MEEVFKKSIKYLRLESEMFTVLYSYLKFFGMRTCITRKSNTVQQLSCLNLPDKLFFLNKYSK